MRDPYLVLGVDSKSTAEDIKKSYRKLAKKYHPDLNPGDKEIERRFKEITQAYDIIGDPDKRRKFDLGEIDAGGQERHSFTADQVQAANNAATMTAMALTQKILFNEFFGGKNPFTGESTINEKKKPAKAQGADIKYSLRLSFLKRRVASNVV